jgi:hypothetical protein
LLPLVAGCGSQNQDSLIGKNVDLNAIVETNSDEVNAAADDMAEAAANQSTSTAQQPQTATLNGPTSPTTHSSQRAPAADDPGVSTDPAFNQSEDDATQPYNTE